MKEPRNRWAPPIPSGPVPLNHRKHEPTRAAILDSLENIAKWSGFESLAQMRAAVLRTRKVRV